MARRSRRLQVVGAVVALAAIVAVVVIGLVDSGSSGGHAAPPDSIAGGSVPSDSVPSDSVPSDSVPSSAAPSQSAPSPTTTDRPSAADVAAARACQAFAVYLEDAEKGQVPAADGRALVGDAAALLSGAARDEKAGRALPKWAALGSDLLAAAQDVVTHKEASFRTDGAVAASQCRLVPASAAKAGGFQRST
jgi:hypothetical protein